MEVVILFHEPKNLSSSKTLNDGNMMSSIPPNQPSPNNRSLEELFREFDANPNRAWEICADNCAQTPLIAHRNCTAGCLRALTMRYLAGEVTRSSFTILQAFSSQIKPQ